MSSHSPLLSSIMERIIATPQTISQDSTEIPFTNGCDDTIVSPAHFRSGNLLREVVVKFWFWEVAACVFSLLSLASIVGVLSYEDGKPLDGWQWSIPPTATVSFIGTLGKASLVLVLSQVLSQTKWLHFRETKSTSLQHIRIFDGASRGPLGAMLIIWKSRKLLALASIGACLMVLTILIDPFIQLVFTFPSKLAEDNSQLAMFNRTNYWNGSWDTIDNIYVPPPSIDAHINAWLASTNIIATAVCPSGNCTWSESIKTIGVCGSCLDVTTDIKTSCSTSIRLSDYVNSTLLTCNYTLDDVYMAQAYRVATIPKEGESSYVVRTIWNSTTNQRGYDPNIIVDLPTNKTRFELDGHSIVPPPAFNNTVHQNLLFKMDIIQFPGLTSSDLEENSLPEMPAAKCSNCEIYWCEKSFNNVRVENNSPPAYNITTERLWFIEDTVDEAFYGLYPSDFGTLNSIVWNLRYRVDDDLQERLNSLFISFYTGSPPLGNTDSQINLLGQHDVVYGLALSKDMDATIRRLADSLTELVRTGPDATETVGQTWVTKSFIKVHWEWLALPLALVVMTCVLLLIVSIKSYREEVAIWKDDPLALLFHNVNSANILPGSKIGTSDLDNLADEVYARLDKDRPFQFVVSTKTA